MTAPHLLTPEQMGEIEARAAQYSHRLREYGQFGLQPYGADAQALLGHVAALEGQIKAHEEVHADKRRLICEIDVILNGVEGAAKQASLCDLVRDIEQLAAELAEARAIMERAAPWIAIKQVAHFSHKGEAIHMSMCAWLSCTKAAGG